jgi:methyl-accepting chemotaxis protein
MMMKKIKSAIPKTRLDRIEAMVESLAESVMRHDAAILEMETNMGKLNGSMSRLSDTMEKLGTAMTSLAQTVERLALGRPTNGRKPTED